MAEVVEGKVGRMDGVVWLGIRLEVVLVIV
jgi:hypothetical protein